MTSEDFFGSREQSEVAGFFVFSHIQYSYHGEKEKIYFAIKREYLCFGFLKRGIC